MQQVLIAQSEPGTAPSAEELEPHGWTVLAAPNAASCMRLARQERPDVAVVAAHLPDGSGAHVVQRLRALLHTAVTPILGLAAEPTEAQALLEAGAQECLEPPVSSDELLGALARQSGSELSFATAPAAVIGDLKRLEALGATDLLDTLPEEDIDRFTRLASNLLDAPVALVSLVDAERQFFKSEVGLRGSAREARQTPLTHSFCQWAVSAREPFVVNDSRKDPIVKNNPAIEELDVGSYCGVPIFVRDQAIGSLCVIDSEPRVWNDQQLTTLKDLAGILSSYLELRAG